jgi:predicted nucleotidyltransferase
MKYYRPLDNLLGQKSAIKILRYLSLARLEMNGRQIAADTGLSPWACHLALRELAEQGIVVMRNVGRTYLFRLNDKNYIAERLLLPLFAAEGELLQAAIREITDGLPDSVVSVVLYGSVSRREERPSSDVDLLILVAGEPDREPVRELLAQKNESFVARFGNILSPLVLPVREFIRRYRDHDAFIDEIANAGQVVYGKLISEVIAHGAKEDPKQSN